MNGAHVPEQIVSVLGDRVAVRTLERRRMPATRAKMMHQRRVRLVAHEALGANVILPVGDIHLLSLLYRERRVHAAASYDVSSDVSDAGIGMIAELAMVEDR